MSEVKDPMIKLFGKTISFQANKVVDSDHAHEERKQDRCSTVLDNKSATRGDLTGRELEVDIVKKTEDESVEPETPSRNSETPNPPAADTETLSPNVTQTEEQSETSASKETTLRNQDKVLKCARCNSTDTKFCYYNNNNVNQPRHFCKSCQRYWTAGGTMRNVPVGSGRRRNKSNYMTVSEASHMLEADGVVLAFSSERPLSESMASVLDLAGIEHAFIPNGFRGNETRLPISSSLHQEPVLRMPYFPETTFHSHMNTSRYSSSASRHVFSHSGFPVTFYPPSPWNVQYPSASSPSSNQLGMSTNPLSALGKRHRNGSMLTSSSSFTRSPMRIKNDTKDSCNGESLFNAFYPNNVNKNHIVDTSLVLQANPAAFSRSVNFHESA